MYLDRTYRPRRRRGRFRLWPFLLLIVAAIVLYEQQPRWLVAPAPQPTAVPTRSAIAFQADAESALREGDFAAALAAYAAMAELEPANPLPWVAQSRLNLILQDLPRAYDLAQRALTAAPDDPAALTALARAEDWLGNYEDALNHALDALEIEPQSAETLAVLAEIYTDVGNWDVAQDYLDQAKTVDSSHVLTLRNQAYLNERRGNYTQAVVDYERAIEVAPYRFDLYLEKARQYSVGLLEYEQANEVHRKAVDVYESAITLDALGFGLYNVGDHLSAVRVLRQAIELDPDYGPAQVHLGMALYARRNYEDAVTALDRGVALLGDSARVEHLYTLGLAYVYKDPPECDKARPWLLRALALEPETGPALDGLALCEGAELTPPADGSD